VVGPKLPFGIDERANGSADLSDPQAQWPKVLSASADPGVTSRSTSRFKAAPSRYEVLPRAPLPVIAVLRYTVRRFNRAIGDHATRYVAWDSARKSMSGLTYVECDIAFPDDASRQTARLVTR
jgi:hypothetical protein